MLSQFTLGRTVITPAALATVEAAGIDPASLLHRHACGDWGTVTPALAAVNTRAVQEGRQVLSTYQVATETVFVITEPDHSVTTILLASDY